MVEDDAQIIVFMSTGNERAIALIKNRYGEALYGTALQLVRDRDAAQEVLQRAFIKIWQKSHLYNPEKARLFTWLFQVVRNTALDYIRKQSKNRTSEIQEHHTSVYIEQPYVDVETSNHLKDRISKLDPNYQAVLRAIFYGGMTHNEAAEHLNMPLGTVKTRVRNALKELRQLMSIIVLLLLT